MGTTFCLHTHMFVCHASLDIASGTSVQIKDAGKNTHPTHKCPFFFHVVFSFMWNTLKPNCPKFWSFFSWLKVIIVLFWFHVTFKFVYLSFNFSICHLTLSIWHLNLSFFVNGWINSIQLNLIQLINYKLINNY